MICSNTTDCFAGDDVLLSITEEDLNMLPTSTLEEFVDLLSDIAEEAGATILSTEDFETESGLSGIVLTIEYFDLYQAKRFIVVQDDLAFTMTYMRDSGNVEDLWPLAEFSFGSLVELK